MLTWVALVDGVSETVSAGQSTWEARIPDVGVVLTNDRPTGRHREDAAHAKAAREQGQLFSGYNMHGKRMNFQRHCSSLTTQFSTTFA